MSAPAAPQVTEAPATLCLVRNRVDARLDGFLSAELDRWSAFDPLLHEPLERLRHFAVTGGKRLRPAFCHLGLRRRGRTRRDPGIVDAGAALELLHVFALVHDDVMDGSDLRRGEPTVHQHFGQLHRRNGWSGESRRFGEGVAILVGDLALVLADRLLAGADRRAWDVYDELRVELVMGQYLDVGFAANRSADPETSRKVSLFKSGQVHRRAAAAPGRGPGRPPGRPGAGRSAATASRWARRSSSATTCWAPSATRPWSASRSATTSARASRRCW